MTLQLGDLAPDLTAETTEGAISFHEWLGEGWRDLVLAPEGLHPRLYD